MDTINILCFGDSLTQGYSQWGLIITPYATTMKSTLDTAWSPRKVNVDVDGVPGDQVVTGLFLNRITQKCRNAETPYDWIIILGGTNDLGYGLEPDDIFAGLQKVFDVALDHGANVLAMTVPECAALSERLDNSRNELNRLIERRGGDRFYHLDLFTVMPYHSMIRDKENRDRIWDDGLHFKPYGYSVIGHHVANRLQVLFASGIEQKNLRVKADVSTTRAIAQESREQNK